MKLLEARCPIQDWARGIRPFEVLVSTILSQSTTVASERRGLEGLRQRFGCLSPEVLARAHETEITKAIWHSGLARQKGPRIKATTQTILEEWGGRLDRILAMPTSEARRVLMGLPGVGPKTADVVMAMAADRPVFPVDTHITRIARRWNLARRGGYEATRTALERWTPPEKRIRWHLTIIAHGRALCVARNPRCKACPVTRDCDWYRTLRAPSRHSQERKRRARGPQQQKVKNR